MKTYIHFFLLKLTAELLGFEGYISPYSTASGQEILKGVNYASAAAGIREETGQQLVPFILSLLNYMSHYLNSKFSNHMIIKFYNYAFVSTDFVG